MCYRALSEFRELPSDTWLCVKCAHPMVVCQCEDALSEKLKTTLQTKDAPHVRDPINNPIPEID